MKAAVASRGRKGSKRLEARVSPQLKRLFQRAADLQGVTLSDFLVSSARQTALQTVQEREIVRLSERDSRFVAEMLIYPPAPSPRLRAAMRRHRKAVARRMVTA